MIYPHQQKAIDYITSKLFIEPDVDALLISGSIAHGFNTENSDVDIYIVISNSLFEQKKINSNLMYFESLSIFYNTGYIDGKYITLDYIKLVAEKGNDPSRYALHDAILKFDKTHKVEKTLKDINTVSLETQLVRSHRFLSQLQAWKWYCDEAIKKENNYLLDLSVSKLILFGGRLILLHNNVFFPYHKWFLKVLENATNKPACLSQLIDNLLIDKSVENINEFYNAIINFHDWTEGKEYNCWNYFLQDIEHNWMFNNEFIENI